MKKLLNKKGFTLMEMLIVVAIIVILVAVSIPAFSGALDKAKVSADAANFRSAKAAAVLHMSMGETVADGTVYNIDTGKFDAAATGADNKGSCSAHSGAYIVFDSSVDGVFVRWTTNGTDTVAPCN